MDQDRTSSGSAAGDGHYVQVRYPHGERWLAVVNMVETRRAAARIADVTRIDSTLAAAHPYMSAHHHPQPAGGREHDIE